MPARPRITKMACAWAVVFTYVSTPSWRSCSEAGVPELVQHIGGQPSRGLETDRSARRGGSGPLKNVLRILLKILIRRMKNITVMILRLECLFSPLPLTRPSGIWQRQSLDLCKIGQFGIPSPHPRHEPTFTLLPISRIGTLRTRLNTCKPVGQRQPAYRYRHS